MTSFDLPLPKQTGAGHFRAATVLVSSLVLASPVAAGQMVSMQEMRRPTASVLPDAHAVRAETTASQAYFWTTQWQQGEREADADIRAGRVSRFESADDAIAWLFGPEA